MRLHVAYIAGFLDADGSITAYCQPQTYGRIGWAIGIDVTFFNQDYEVLADIRETLDCGIIRAVRCGHSGVYRLEFSRRQTKSILELLLPHLRVKRRQAELSLKVIATQGKGGRRRITDTVLAYRKDLIAQISELNQRNGKALRKNWVNSVKPSAVPDVAAETIPSQAPAGSTHVEGTGEGVTTRAASPNSNQPHESPARKGRDSLRSVATLRSVG